MELVITSNKIEGYIDVKGWHKKFSLLSLEGDEFYCLSWAASSTWKTLATEIRVWEGLKDDEELKDFFESYLDYTWDITCNEQIAYIGRVAHV